MPKVDRYSTCGPGRVSFGEVFIPLPLLEVKIANFFSMVNYYPRNLKLKNRLIADYSSNYRCQFLPGGSKCLTSTRWSNFLSFYLRSPPVALPIPYSSTNLAWDAPAF